MYLLFTPTTAAYLSLYLSTIVIGVSIFQSVDGLTYQVVTVFITLIIISNCIAKLYARILLNEDV